MKNTKAEDALTMSGKVIEIFRKHNLYCPGCKVLGGESIEKIGVCNGMDANEIMEELNGSLK